MIRRLQNRVAESRNSLPVMLLYSIGAWLLMGIISNRQLWPCFVIFLICTYMMVELNNRNFLLRTYSRMVSCSYIALAMMLPMLYQSYEVPLMQMFWIAFFFWSFKTYQNRSDAGHTYVAFLAIGMLSLLWMPIVWFVPLMWIACGAFLLSMGRKNFFASIFGLLTPYWFLLPAAIFTDRIDDIISHFAEILPGDEVINILYDPEIIMTYEWDVDVLPSLVPLAMLIVLSILGITHYIRNSFQDKIQTRMYYQSFVMMTIACLIVILIVMLLPFDRATHLPYLTSMLLICTAPLIGHYITFTKTRVTNASFVVLFLIIIVTTIIQSLPTPH